MPSSIPLIELRHVAGEIAQRFSTQQYALRGTASLVLQGLDMGVSDIDVLGDDKLAQSLNLKISESKSFKSYFGKMEISGIQVEVMANFQIRNLKGEWSEVFDASADEITQIDIDGVKVNVTTPATELKCYALMNRWSAYHKLKKQL